MRLLPKHRPGLSESFFHPMPVSVGLSELLQMLAHDFVGQRLAGALRLEEPASSVRGVVKASPAGARKLRHPNRSSTAGNSTSATDVVSSD